MRWIDSILLVIKTASEKDVGIEKPEEVLEIKEINENKDDQEEATPKQKVQIIKNGKWYC